MALLLWLPRVQAQSDAHPLAPPDRSSPRAALATFLASGDALGRFLRDDYLPSPTRAEYHRVLALADAALQSLDLGQVPPAARTKTGRAAAIALYVTLSRIPLPATDSIPDLGSMPPPSGTNAVRWVIPNTEIALVRTPGRPHDDDFLFAPETVARAEEFYQRVLDRPYLRQVPLENLREITLRGGGWMIRHAWIAALPDWLRAPLAGQSVWKWIALTATLAGAAFASRPAYALSHRGSPDRPFVQALAQLALPAYFLLAAPAFAYLALVQINVIGTVGSRVQLGVTAVLYLAGAWISWRLAPVVAEALIASPRIAPESIDAHFIRISARLLGIVAATSLLVAGADQLGLPLYGVLAGLGVGGLAIALAAQPAIENLLGGLSLYADKPVRIGDLCRYGTDTGTVEAIGLRSTRMRGQDRTLTTIPNAVLSKLPVVNLSRRDKMLVQTVLGVRYETRPDQLRHLLAKIRETLLSHPRIESRSVRVRFVAFGASSLDLEIVAYVTTRERDDFLAVQEDVLLRIMDLVAESGTGLAFPSQTLYLARDGGVDDAKASAAETEVHAWRAESRLPFPDFSPEARQRMHGTLAYPPPGSACPNAAPEVPRGDDDD
jgi:MscS family membrane protein